FHDVGDGELRYHPTKLTTSPMDLFMTVQKRTISADRLPRTFVVYGSNMGTSDDYATQMAEQLKRMGFADITLVLPMAGAPLVVAITSTYNGMPPDNARNFAKLLDQETRADILKDVDFFPRHLYQRLDELGATPLTEFTAGDSNDDLDDESGMILTDHYGSSVDAYIDVATDKSLSYSLKYVDNSPAAPFRLSLENASVKVNRELQDDISYTTGDHLNIYPVNAPSLDTVFELEQVSDASRFARSAAAAYLWPRMHRRLMPLQYVCDWKEAPSRELAQNRTVLDVLRTYAPLVRQIPFATLLHFVSAMDPRRYSIASCQSVVGNEVHISAAIVNDTVNGRSYGGLATEYLASLEAGAPQDVFHLPPSSDVPVVFVSAGTGVAPQMKLAGIGDAAMYFGCRSPEYDYLYKDELEQYVQDGTLSKLQTAFSRYVQHHVSQDGPRSGRICRSGGRIYVCGSADKLGKSMSAAMASDV
ncbi:riboflavin synthase domain-like protein, partial [Linderina pennispora]